MNKVVLIGRLTRDPELRYTTSNIPSATFSLAVNRPFQSQNGTREADFINIVMWRKTAETAKKYLTKGSLIAVEGRIQTRNYDGADGKKVYVTEVVAEEAYFADSKRDGADSASFESTFGTSVASSSPEFEVTSSDDLPF